MNGVEKNIQKIKTLCKRYNVTKLYLFGSTLSGRFNENSDVDLLVQFGYLGREEYADNYFDFKFSLEDVLKRQVDLLEDHAINNPYLRKSIDSSKQLIYG